MQKLSKSSKIDKDQEARDKELLANPKLSPHFMVGSKVKIAHLPPATIIDKAYMGRYVAIVVEFPDGTQDTLIPYALNRS